VIVAGGGPVGSFLAAELSRFGRSVVVVESQTEVSRLIKAGTVGPQSAELFDQRGLLEAFPQPDLSMFPAPGPATPTSTPAAPVSTMPVGHFAGLWLLRGAPEIRRMPIFASQYDVETVLAAHLEANGVPVLRGHQVIRVNQDDDGVRVVVHHESGDGGEEITLTGQYLVGCDGGRSLVRKQAGFDFPGTDPTITGRQALVDLAEPNPLHKGWHRTDRGMIVFGPGPQRVLTVEFDAPPTDRSAPLTRDEIEASLRRVSGTDVTVTALHNGTRWTDNTRQVTDYRRGRILLAGDAAHVHPPFGGQGLNLGFQDASNLGWKLAAVLQCHAPSDLLDSYSRERRPAADATLRNTRAQIALMRPDPQTTELRELFTELMAYDDANQHVSRLMTGVHLPYDVGSDHPEAGTMVTDRVLGQHRLYELLRTPGGLLVDGSGNGRWATAASGWTDRIHVVTAPAATESLLIRPDGVLIWGSAQTDDDTSTPGQDAARQSLISALTRWFGTAAADRSTGSADAPPLVPSTSGSPH
jgi:2-polyprenyl-6-methoxyphenol hydroxylase-like FAD-dependent oxidoreductase